MRRINDDVVEPLGVRTIRFPTAFAGRMMVRRVVELNVAESCSVPIKTVVAPVAKFAPVTVIISPAAPVSG